MDVATQTELTQKHAATQLSGCRECQSLSLGMDGSSENSCVRCDQVDDLLSLVAELREEVERLRSIREAEKEIDWWSQALPSLRQKQTPDKTQDEGDPISSPCQDEGRSLKGRSEWKQVHTWSGRRTSSLPTSPSQVPLYNRYEALAVEGQSKEDMDDSRATPEVSPRPEKPTPHIVTTPTKKKSMGNKQEELETCTCLQGYDLIGITETWWHGSYDWSVGMEGYRLFRKDRQGRRGGGVALYVNGQLECMELHLGMDEEPIKSLWVRIKGSTGAGDIIVGVCYRPPDQGD
ncbi:hypothetical protein GRJ2_003297900 [Grus japonensis]|uniref:Uncharacterized protein n=1 Tax=Grus japonensis TaxID=30415 RepID=A0ABC9YFI5_GRUJA